MMTGSVLNASAPSGLDESPPPLDDGHSVNTCPRTPGVRTQFKTKNSDRTIRFI